MKNLKRNLKKITSVNDLIQKMGENTRDKNINKKKGEIFEKYCQWLLNKRLDSQLYRVENVGDTSNNRIYTQSKYGDGGVDLNIINKKNNKNIPVQCKYNSSKNKDYNHINVQDIRNFHSVMVSHKIEIVIFIATTYFSENALMKVNDIWYDPSNYKGLKIFCINNKCLDKLIKGTFDLSFLNNPNDQKNSIHPVKWYPIKVKQQKQQR